MDWNNRKMNRRQFMTKGTKAAGAIVGAGSISSCTTTPAKQPAKKSKTKTETAKESVLGANERVNLAVIGIRNRGRALSEKFAKLDGVSVKTLCDVDENLMPKRAGKVQAIQRSPVDTEYDLRKVYDDKDIDAVVIATPEHWHALATIWACQAGKHVYVEKPSSHKIWEGRKMVEAARKYNRLVQVGFQYRSMGPVREAMKFLHDGGLGDIYMIRCPIFKPRESIGHEKNQPVPAGVHYDMWLGPAEKRPFNPNRFHYNWNWFWDYGSGDMVANGAHMFDLARWALNRTDYPRRIRSMGGYFAFDSDQQTPNTQTGIFEYDDGKILQCEVRGLYTNAENDIKIGIFFYGTKGWMYIDSGNWETFFARKDEPGPSMKAGAAAVNAMNLAGTGDEPHLKNFIAALRSGNRKDLNCEILEGHLSSSIGRLANISYRLGRDVTFDSSREEFLNDDQANAMLRRDDREPYVVPESV